MNAKEWLSRAFKIDQQIASKHEQIEMWRTLAECTTSDPSAVPSGSNNNSSRVETYSIKIADAQADIGKQILQLVDIKREIESIILRVLDTTSRILLEQRYLLCKGWENIAEFMGYDETYIKKVLHRRALDDVRDYIPHE